MEIRTIKAVYDVVHADGPEWYGTRITDSATVDSIMRPLFGDAPDESVWALYLDGGNQAISASLIGVGGPGESSASPAKILRNGLLCNARSYILVHNHPSGLATPSAGDRAITEQLVRASDIVEMPMLDHLILGRKSRWSFCDNGLIAEYRRRK